jgi:hypothetical protein
VDPLWAGRENSSRVSLYAYSDNDVVNLADPFGLDSCSSSGGELVCSFSVTTKLRALGLEGPGGGGGSQGSTINSIGPGALEQDIPLAQQAYGGNVPTDAGIAGRLKSLVAAGAINDCEALALYVGEIVTRDIVTGTNAGAKAINDSMQQLTPWTPAGVIVSLAFGNFGHTRRHEQLQTPNQISGYKTEFQEGNNDQGHHVAFYLQLGYGLSPTNLTNVLQNVALMTALPVLGEFLQLTPSNVTDANLGTVAMAIGAGLRNGTISPSQAAARIHKDLCK